MDLMPTILSLCDYTGIWSDPYRAAGYRVVQIDLQRNGQDIRIMPNSGKLHGVTKVHGIIAQPPCTHLSSSGARWWASKGETALLDALSIADACLRFVLFCKPTWWVLENPVGRLSRFYGKPRYTFHPHEYSGWPGGEGDTYTKKTCLWGEFNIPEKRSRPPSDGSRMHRLYPGPDRANLRSATPRGFSRAFYEANP